VAAKYDKERTFTDDVNDFSTGNAYGVRPSLSVSTMSADTKPIAEMGTVSILLGVGKN
jgi:hypothetical protein